MEAMLVSTESTPKKAATAAKLGIFTAVLGFCVGYFAVNVVGQSHGSKHSDLSARTQASSQMRAAFLEDDVSEVPESVARFFEAKESTTDTMQVNSDTLAINVHNHYTEDNPIESGTKYRYPWTNVAEPYKTTTLAVKTPVEGAWYKWMVDGHVQGYGAVVECLFTDVGSHDVVVIEKASSGDTAFLTAKVMVKYVRREIRSLTDIDREKFFNAVHIMARVPTEVGQKMYGTDYKSKDYFNRVHLYYGGTADCDHWHQGAGFVTSHVTFTLEYEKAIQSVFPDTSVPYWDFTLESTFYEATTWRNSPIFASSWFGDLSPDNNLHTVTDGRWAYEQAMTRAENFSAIHNSYGVLRAPWNNDPTPFMTRHDHVYGLMNNMKPSGCKEYFVALKKTTWMSMSRQLNAAAHGHIHETVGGSWNHYYANRVGADNVGPQTLTFAHEIQALSKELWRTGFVKCPETCSMDTAWQDCQCTYDASADKSGMTSYEILDKAGVLDGVEYYDAAGHLISKFKDENGTVYYPLPGYTEEETKHIYDELLEMIATPGHIGDMFQATSSNDITFWVLHGTVDRLWHYKRLGNTDNFDETWDPYHTCYGHNPSNFQPFKNIFDNLDRYYTNEELYENLHPEKATIPYMYDGFSWPHCELQGYDMSNEW